MFGQFQQSNIRLEIKASSQIIRDSLTQPAQVKQWLWPWRGQQLPEEFQVGTHFTTRLGGVPITHTVETCHDHGLRFLLSQGIDGFHAWSWDDGWLQSHLEGISLLPLNLGQTATLLSLRYFIEAKAAQK
jgi:hypothetical protein